MTATFDTLATVFEGSIVTKSSPDYPIAIHRYFKNAEKPARVVLYPASTADIARALVFARAKELPLVVAGGGHSAGGASSIDDGVVLDLSRHFGQVEVVLAGDGNAPQQQQQQPYVKAGGGSRWGEVDKKAMEHGLATTAGLVAETGVGGLTLGGGYGWLTGAHGLACDNLIGATVVLASGDVVEADAATNPDLFWALRGGGGAFGIVTEFRLALHPTSKRVYMRFAAVPAAKAHEAIPRFLEWSRHVDEQTTGGMGFDLGPDGHSIVVHWATFLGPKADVGERLQAFDQIEGFATMLDEEVSYERANTVIGSFEPEGSCRYWSSIFAVATIPVYEALLKVFSERKADREVPGAHFALQAIAFHPAKVASVPADATAFAHRDPKKTILQLNLIWPDPADFDPAKAQSFMASVRALVVSAAAAAADGASAAGYSNFEADESASRADDVFGSNLGRLRELKAKFDPTNVLGGKFGLGQQQQ